MSESTDGQERHAEASKLHDALLARFHADINGIHLACRQLRTRQQEVSSVLQHTALTLQHVNPTASAAISKMILGTDNLCKDVLQRTANLRESVNAIPEPPPPPIEEPAPEEESANEPPPPADVDPENTESEPQDAPRSPIPVP